MRIARPKRDSCLVRQRLRGSKCDDMLAFTRSDKVWFFFIHAEIVDVSEGSGQLSGRWTLDAGRGIRERGLQPSGIFAHARIPRSAPALLICIGAMQFCMGIRQPM